MNRYLFKAPGALHDGATSLVDLILRQFGDDIEGATQELVRIGGFPESVANRIATGELPMDEASRVARREARARPGTLYHGAENQGILNVSPNAIGSNNSEARGTGLWASDEPDVANSFVADNLDMRPDGVIQPLRVLRDGNHKTVDAEGSGWSEILIDGDYADTNGIARAAKRDGYDSVTIENVVDHGMYPDWPNAQEPSSVTAITNPNSIRSPNAAFDPQYTGSNIMGSATVPGMAAAGAGGGVLATALANLDSIVPRGTANAVSDLGVVDSGIAAADTAVRAGQGFLNDIITGGTMVTNAVADQDYEPYEVDIDPGTAQGDTLVGGFIEDMGRLFEYKGVMGNMPSAIEMISGGIDLYNKYVKPHLSDRMEEGLGGAALLAASTPFIPGGRAVREASDIEFDREMDLMQRVKDPDSVNEMQLDVIPGPALLDDPIVSAEDLEGRGFVSGMSDTSRGDRSVITSANGVEMQTDRWGGQDYSRQPENADRGALWAADKGAITGFVNAANATMDLPGVTRSPIWMPYGMMGASTDYAHMTTDFMYPMALENMSKSSQRALDKRVREGAGNKTDYFRPQPDFPGMGKIETEAWLREAGHRRKSLAKAIDEFREDAGVNLSMARGALVDPEQLDPRLGNLRTVGVLNMDNLVANGPHPSYPVDINGRYLGRFGPGANLLDDFTPMRRPAGDRKVADDFRAEMEARGHDLSAKKLPAAVGKAMAQGLIGAFDQETLDWLIKQGYIKS